MKRPKHILARDDGGTQVVILEIAPEENGAAAAPRYELANRSKVEQISENEFVVIATGRVLTRTVAQRR
jgi:hypothetical protein